MIGQERALLSHFAIIENESPRAFQGCWVFGLQLLALEAGAGPAPSEIFLPRNSNDKQATALLPYGAEL